MKKSFCILVAALFLLIGVTSAWAAPVAKEINYTKKTTLVYPKNYTIKFSLWDAETAGNEVWSEQKLIKLTTSSTIKTNLGDTTPLDPADFSQQLWVQVERLKADGITYVLIGTRDKLVAGPYALSGLMKSCIMQETSLDVAAGSGNWTYVNCPAGYYAISCGTYTPNSVLTDTTMSGYFNGDVVNGGSIPTRCLVSWSNDTGATQTLYGFAVCCP